VRFADTMDINEFYDRFSKGLIASQHGCLSALADPLGRWTGGTSVVASMAASLRISAQERRAASPRCRPREHPGRIILAKSRIGCRGAWQEHSKRWTCGPTRTLNW